MVDVELLDSIESFGSVTWTRYGNVFGCIHYLRRAVNNELLCSNQMFKACFTVYILYIFASFVFSKLLSLQYLGYLLHYLLTPGR